MAINLTTGSDQTTYAQSRKKSSFENNMNRLFGSTPYQGQQMQRNAPHNIYGGADSYAPVNVSKQMESTVRGNNIQNDLPGGIPLKDRLNSQVNTLAGDLKAINPTVANRAPNIPPEAVKPTQEEVEQQAQAAQKPPLAASGDHVVAGADQINQLADSHPDAASVGHQVQKDEVMKDYADAASGKVSPDEIMSKPFYQKNSFWKGIIATGLGIASGANPQEAFEAGQKASDSASVSDYFQSHIDDLRKQGYSDVSIQSVIASGNPSLLKMRELSPEEKRKQELEDQARQDERQDKSIEAQFKRQELANQAAQDRADRSAIAAEKRQADREEAAQVKADAKKYTDYSKGYRTSNAGFVRINVRQNTFATKAEQWWNQYQQHIKDGDEQAAAADLKFASSELENSQIVGQRSTTPEEVQAATRVGGLWDQMITKATQLKNGTLDADATRAFGESVKNAAKMEHEVIENKSYNDYEIHRNAGFSPEQSAEMVNGLRSSANARGITKDKFEEEYQKRQDPNYIPGNGSEAPTTPQRQGAMSQQPPQSTATNSLYSKYGVKPGAGR